MRHSSPGFGDIGQSLPITEALRYLRESLGAVTIARRGITRIEAPLPAMDILGWLRTQRAEEKWYWDDNRDGSLILGGIGAADVIHDITAMDARAVSNRIHAMLGEDLQARLRGRYFGGMTFLPSPYVDNSWQHFGCYRFVLPRLEIVRMGKHHIMGLNLLPDDTNPQAMDDIRRMLEAIATTPKTDTPLFPMIEQRQDIPDRDGWEALLTRAIADIRNGIINKVALARKVILTLDSMIEPLDLMWSLRHREPNTLHYYLQPTPEQCFLGASPELLFRQSSEMVYTEAIAGTRRRGANSAEDAELGQDLMTHAKDAVEHQSVVDRIVQGLRALQATVFAEASRLHKMTRVQHKHTPIAAWLPPDCNAGDLLSILHPTPAVGGNPREAALAFIREHEPFERGWFAGVVGWIGYNRAEFAVGIRSALAEGNRLSVFSGAGIVAESHIPSEWQELEDKIAHILGLFTQGTL